MFSLIWSPKLWSCRRWVVACRDAASAPSCTRPAVSTVEPKDLLLVLHLKQQSSLGLLLPWAVVPLTASTLGRRERGWDVFSLLKGLPVLEQIAWPCISRARIWVFTILLIALFPAFHVQNTLYGHSGGASLSGISLSYSKVVVINSQNRVP